MMASISTATSPSIATGAPAPVGEDRLPLKVCLGFGVGSVGVAILLNTITTFFPVLMTTVLGQSAALAGLLLTVSKLYDVLADLLIGMASDRTQSRWGRRRPYLLAGAVIASFSFLMIFMPPPLTDGWLTVYMGVALVIYSTGYSLFAVPYIAMAGEMTDGYHERTRLLSFRSFFAAIGQLIGAAGTAGLIEYMGGGSHGYAAMGAAAAAIIFTTMILTFAGTGGARRRDVPPRTHLPKAGQIRSLLSNRPFTILMGAKITQYVAISTVATTKLLFFLNVLNIGYVGLINATFAQYVVQAASVPVWAIISRRIGKKPAYLIAILMLGAAYGSWIFATPGVSMVEIWIRGALQGMAAAGTTLISISMLPDVMEYDRRLTGNAREGVFSSIYAMLEKLSFAIGPGLVGLMLSLAGYVATTKGALVTQSPATIAALYAGASGIPAILALVSFVIMLFYRLDEKMLGDTVRAG
ncbi:MAG: MFS transporter [Pseudomonadota bacterium]